MQYWKRVDVGDFRKHAKDVLEVIDLNTGVFWNHMTKEQMDLLPDLMRDLRKYGEIKDILALVLYDDTTTLHTDGSKQGVVARLNIPILNTEGSITEFYEFGEHHKEKYQTNEYGTQTWPIVYTLLVKPITKVAITEPTIIRNSAPHFVKTASGKKPRVTLSVAFTPDISRFLED